MRMILLLVALACPACGGGPADPDLTEGGPPNVALQAAADTVLTRTNEERARAGLPGLVSDPDLVRVAQAHARDMARRGYFSHTNPEGQGPRDRVQAAGLSHTGVGENIAHHFSAASAMSAWMASSGHRANILRESYTLIGVGVYRPDGSGGNHHYVQVFAR